MGIVPYDNQSHIQLLHRYRLYNGYRGYQQQAKLYVPYAYRGILHETDSTSTNSLIQRNYDAFDFESFKVTELRGKWFFHKRWELNVWLPLIQNKMKTDNQLSNVTKLGDPLFSIAYHVIQKMDSDKRWKHRVIIGCGIKPGVQASNSKNAIGQRFHLSFQPTTGSSDVFTNLNYTLGHKQWGLNTNAMIKYSFKNSYHEQILPALNQNLALFYKKSIKKITLIPSINMNYEYSKGISVHDKIQKNTSVNVLLCGSAIDMVYKNMSLNFGYQFKAYEHIEKGGLSNARRIIVALTYNFKQTGYLLK